MSELQGGQKVRVLLAQALFGHPDALLLDEPTNHLDLDSIHWLREFLIRYDGTLIVISHDRHFLNEVCTHIADIDYQTIITYTGGYDDMVLAKTQIRSRIEADNAQREKKIAQLNDFIARFSAGTRSSQVQSRRKEVERLETDGAGAVEHPAPVHQVRDGAAVRPHGAGVQGRVEGVRRSARRLQLQRGRQSRREGRAGRPQRRRQDHAAASALLSDAPGMKPSPGDIDAGTMRWGHEVSIGYFSQDHTGAIQKGHDGRRVAAPVRSGRVTTGDSRPARPDAVQRRGGTQADRGAFGRRDRAAALLPHHAAEAERARVRRADEPPRPRNRSTR